MAPKHHFWRQNTSIGAEIGYQIAVLALKQIFGAKTDFWRQNSYIGAKVPFVA
jgi:hypothetical protein